MIYNTEELLKKYKNFHGINKAIKSKRIRRISHGLYSDKDSCVSDLENLFARYPNAILTMESAFSYYGLTDYIPDKYYVVTKQNAHRIEQHNVSQLFISNNIFDIGKQTVKTKYGFINIYDKERLLIELFSKCSLFFIHSTENQL